MAQRGSIRQRGKTWTAYWFVTGENGRRRQRSKGGFRTKRAAQGFLNEILGDVQHGTYNEPRRITVAQFMREHWLPSLDKRPTTMASYDVTVEKWIIPHLGGVILPALTPQNVQKMLETLRARGGKRGRPLSPRSAQYAYTVLRMALSHAVRQGYIARNPAAQVECPRAKAKEQLAWRAEEAAVFLTHARGHRLYVAWLLFLTRGFRRGEVAGLRWEDVDLDASRLSIRSTRVVLSKGSAILSDPKTDRGRRTVPLDETLVDALKAHRRLQLEERMAWGAGWVDSGLVFTREDGTPLRPDYLSALFDRLTRHAVLRRIRLHDTRHTAATLALRAGIPTEVVSRWLGHASVAITQDTYQHAIPSMMEEAGAKLTSLIMGKNASLLRA